jgi:hypothetical protein
LARPFFKGARNSPNTPHNPQIAATSIAILLFEVHAKAILSSVITMEATSSPNVQLPMISSAEAAMILDHRLKQALTERTKTEVRKQNTVLVDKDDSHHRSHIGPCSRPVSRSIKMRCRN